MGRRLYFSSAGLYWKVSTWLTPPLMNNEITALARGLKCGGLGKRGDPAPGAELVQAPGDGVASAASKRSWLNKSIRARPPIPMPASIQNLRREMNSRRRL